MTNKEKKYLDYINERVCHCLKRGIDQKQVAEWIDDVIYNLSDECYSSMCNELIDLSDEELISKLGKIYEISLK